MSLAPTRVTRLLTALSIAVASIYWIARFVLRWRNPVLFDDAYMFYRYALHIREGLGISWNLDGIHTYGETSPLWGVAVLLLSYLPLSPSHALLLGSWLCSVGAIAAIAWAVARNAQSEYLNSTWRVLPLVAIPALISPLFAGNAFSGMETMLAVLLSALFIGTVLAWDRGQARSAAAGLTGLLLFLDRPEAGAAVIVMPGLAYILARRGAERKGRTKGLAILWLVFLLGVALDLGCSWIYFGTPLPLSFYMKSGHAYEGYYYSWEPVSSLFWLLLTLWPYLLLQALARGADWRRNVLCLAPLLPICGYLLTVTQIMGAQSRYYFPYIPFVMISGLLVLDRCAGSLPSWSREYLPLRGIAVAGCCCALCGIGVYTLQKRPMILGTLLSKADRRVEGRNYAYDPVRFRVEATRRLPEEKYLRLMAEISRTVLKGLPAGSTMATSEVGYTGAEAPQVNLIDIAGLNDTRIALHGFDMDDLLARRPDIIWMPHTDYTYQRGLMLSNRHLLEQYDVLAGAADYGIALRKDSPIRPLLDSRMQVLWNDLYPGYRMSDYLVKGTSWSGAKHRVSPDDAVNKENEKDQLEPVLAQRREENMRAADSSRERAGAESE